MGHIIMPAFAFREALSEDAGVRSGFALDQATMLKHLSADHILRSGLESDDALRVASDVYADTVGDLLHALGTTDQPGMPTLGIRLAGILDEDWRSLFALDEFLELEAVANHYLRLKNEGSAEQEDIFRDLRSRVSDKPKVLEALVEAMALHLAFSPFFTKNVERADLIALEDLFESERLPTCTGSFIDQRFINYLASHTDALSNMHWRQFEGLTAEWFRRKGYEVELGPGRNDGSIDVRAWNADAEPGAPPTLIVQCKRQKTKVDRVTVKALYADIIHESSAKGMIVTTSDISRGAAKDVKARAYPITTANRGEVQRWIEEMRKLNAGVVSDEFATAGGSD